MNSSANVFGKRATPSYVLFNENGWRQIGDVAKNQSATNHSNTIGKRLLGRQWNDDKEQFPFPNIGEHCSKLFRKRSERYGNYQYLLISNEAQREATKNAGTIAGLNVLKILNEPTAAAMAYALNTDKDEKIILVYDLGGGTLDISVMSIKDSVFTVLSTCGNTHLGGEDFDQRVVNYFIKLYQTEKGKDFSKNNQAIQRLRLEVEKGKRHLTFHNSTFIEVDGFLNGEDFSEELTREKFEELNKELFESTLEPLKQALKDARLKKSEIVDVVMVGGSSRIPKIQQLVSEFFDGKELCQKINPDEAIASGAAIQAGILSGEQDSVVLHDVNPLSLGIELYSKKMDVFIPRNTTIPVIKSHNLTTVIDYQYSGLFPIYEGELPVAADNLLLGELILFNIQPAPRGVPQIKTTFEIDENGILHVSAEHSVTKEQQEIAIDYANNRPDRLLRKLKK